MASSLEAMVKLCSDPQLVVDFFVNYDCDLQVPYALTLRFPEIGIGLNLSHSWTLYRRFLTRTAGVLGYRYKAYSYVDLVEYHDARFIVMHAGREPV